MDLDCGRKEGIHHADGLADSGTPAHDASPSVGDPNFNNEEAALEAQRQFFTEPSIETRFACARGKPLCAVS